MTARASVGAVLVALVGLWWACAEFTLVTSPATGTLAVPVAMDSGQAPDSGFVVAVDDTLTQPVHPPDTLTFEVAAGDHTVELRYADGTPVGEEASAAIQHLVMRE